MPLPKVVSDVLIYCCELGTIKTHYRLRQTHRQNLEKLPVSLRMMLVEKIVSVLDMDNFDCTLQGF